jgi:hypothetical protein
LNAALLETDIEDLKQLVLKLSVIAERLDARSENAVLRIEGSADALGLSAAGLHADSHRFTQQVLQAVTAQAGHLLGRGVDQAVNRCNARLHATADVAAAIARNLDEQRQGLQRERRGWVWRAATALIAGSAMAVAGCAYWGMKSRDEIAANQIEGALLRAYNHADVTLCAGGRLCANVEGDGGRRGGKSQYRLVRPRGG